MRKAILIVSLFLLCGCVTTKPMVLLDSETYYLIPANTPFTAVIKDGEKPVSVKKTSNAYVVDAGYLVKLQEQANACVINNK